jgi:hypothetical protein
MDQVIGEVAALNSSSDSDSDSHSLVDERSPKVAIRKKRRETFQVYLTRCMNEIETLSQNEKSLVGIIIFGLPSFLQFIFATNQLDTVAELEETFRHFDEIEAQNIGRISQRHRQTRFPNQPSKYFYRKPQSTVNPVPNTIHQPPQCSKKKSKEANLHQARKTNIVETKACFVCNCKFHFQTDCPYK